MRALGGLQPRTQAGQKLLTVEFPWFSARADEPIAGSTDEFGHDSSASTDVHGNRRRRPIVDRSVLGLVVLAPERDAILGPEPTDQRERLSEAAETLFEWGPLHSR